MEPIYLDHAATTPVAPGVLAAMEPFWRGAANASSAHALGRRARQAIDRARLQVARLIGAIERGGIWGTLIFTSGGTESDNLALFGAAARAVNRNHLIVSSVEHHAVLQAAEHLAGQGFRLTRLAVDRHGRIDLDDLASSLDDDTFLVSVMLANNELGTIEPVSEVSRLARVRGALVHTDAVQAVGQIPVDVRELGVDLLTLTAHKFYGPKGAGALWIRPGVGLSPMLFGGSQERKLRPGTENVPAIAGLGAAAELALSEMAERAARVASLRDRLQAAILASVPDIAVNTHPSERLPGHLHLSVAGVTGESLVLALDLAGVCASTGSACAAGSIEESHVLQAIGRVEERDGGSVRLSLGRETTAAEVDEAARRFAQVVERLRAKRGASSEGAPEPRAAAKASVPAR